MSSSHLILIMPLVLLTYVISTPSLIIIVNAFFPYPSYEDCAPYNCESSTIQYPFGKCGILNTKCTNGSTVSLYSDSRFVGRVVGDITNFSYLDRTLRISQENINDSSVTEYYWFSAYQSSFFTVSDGYTMGTISDCSNPQCEALTWALDSTENSRYSFCTGFEGCTSYRVIIPNDTTYNITTDQNFEKLYQIGFQIRWVDEGCNSCRGTGGRCAFYACVCPDNSVHRQDCVDGSVLYPIGKRVHLMPVIFSAVCAIVFGIAVASLVAYMVVRRQRSAKPTASDEGCLIRAFMDPLDPRPPSLENFLHYYKSQVPTRYSYSQIKAYTNNLADKIGNGGFGTVYKGRLPSGSVIAVKILDNTKQTEHQFIAEVATVGTTYHVNLVRLLGYCSKGSKRALVYEYMVNGSLDKYIHGGHEDELDWKQLYSIAVGTARGIAYLHEECRNRILHCDIKPHNVLLDANFLPKVAYFGLAKISKREESHISVVNRGTLGYAAPEMWSRNHGPVTDRADIYSYGMLVMEMVGGRKNIDFDNKESRSSRFFYTEWAFKQVEKGEFGNLRKGNMSEEDQLIAKKLSLVGMWCIQFNASSRPPICKVIQMLEGDINIPNPPFPFPSDAPPQQSASHQSSSTYALEVELINPTNIESAQSSRFFF